jgi:xanthine dehydrogenase small subunit
MYDILKVFGSLQIRNMATLGGNIGSASPIGDMLPLLLVKGAKIVLRSAAGERIQDLQDFILGYRKTGLRPDEIISGVIIDKPVDGELIRTYKVSKRTDLDIATVSAAFCLALREGVVETVRMAYGGMAAQTMRVPVAEGFLTGKPWERIPVEQAMKMVEEAFTPITDARAGAAYRRKVAGNLLLKFFTETC